jgi:prophage DNA circulation protein
MTDLRPWPGPAGDTGTIIEGVHVYDPPRLAYWRGLPLLVQECTPSGGRRVESIEQNYANGGRVHDMGRKPWSVTMTLVFIGDKWRETTENFLASIDEDHTSGDLVLPNRGPVLTAHVEDWTWEDAEGSSDRATISVSWVEDAQVDMRLWEAPQTAESHLPEGALAADEVAAYQDTIADDAVNPGAADAALAEAQAAVLADMARIDLDTVAGIEREGAYLLANAAMIDAYPYGDDPPAWWQPLGY